MNDTLGTVLVIDDEEGKRYTVARLLRAAGFQVSEGAVGAAALAHPGAPPDVIVLDLKLPDIGGLEVIRRLKAEAASSGTMILALSARLVSPSDWATGLDTGADAYLTHPVEAGVLVATVRALMRIRRAERERQDAFDRLALSEARYRGLTDLMPQLVWTMSDDGAIDYANRAFGAFAGPGRPAQASALVAAEDRPAFAGMLEALARDGGTAEAQVRLCRHDRAARWHLLRAVTLPEHAGAARLLATATDIDDRKRNEDALAATAQFRDELVSILGHDLRNPLSSISLTAERLRRSATLEGRDRDGLGRISTAVSRMGALIDQILDFSQSRLGGGMPVVPRRADLAELCRQLVAEHEPMQVRLEASGDTAGWFDPERIAQVVANLLGNAAQHGDPASLVELRVAGSASALELSVANRGDPIPPETLPELFEAFRRGRKTQGKRTGLGLGLYIVREIVRAHGGTIEASSDRERTRFTIHLPRG